jgi:adenosylcobinamide-phosphate synthase
VNRGLFAACAAATDLAIGDPPAWPHPVNFIAAAIRSAEPLARRYIGDAFVGGAVMSAAVVSAAGLAGAALGRAPAVLRVAAAASTLAGGSLLDHAAAVCNALASGNLSAARSALARIVGRDTEELDESAIARAAIEALAESLCDGVVAPLTALVCFGVSGAFAYKAVNTLDSLIGHIEAPYTLFGRFAARADDVANYLPARLSVLLIAAAATVCGFDGGRALSTAVAQGGQHRSPNAGYSEAAMAGALGVRLGGPLAYDGIRHDAPVIGASFRAPRASDVRDAMIVTFGAVVLAYATAVALEARR